MIERIANNSPAVQLLRDPEPPGKQPPADSDTVQQELPPKQLVAGDFNPDLNRILHDNKMLPARFAQSPEFAASVYGPQQQDSHEVMAQLAQAAYGGPNDVPPSPWQPVGHEQWQAWGIDPALLNDPSTGFQAQVFTDGSGNFVLAFAGSEIIGPDYPLNNIPQAAGMPTPQHAQAAALALMLDAAIPSGGLSFAGHSLGGGLASVAALVTGNPAATFNAAGVHSNTLFFLGLDPVQAHQDAENGLIVTYSVEGEFLTSLQEDGLVSGLLPDAMGTQYVLDDPTPVPQSTLITPTPIIAGIEVADAIADHEISTVIEAMQADNP